MGKTLQESLGCVSFQLHDARANKLAEGAGRESNSNCDLGACRHDVGVKYGNISAYACECFPGCRFTRNAVLLGAITLC